MSNSDAGVKLVTVTVCLQPSGAERIAETPPGEIPSFYSWDFIVATPQWPVPKDAKPLGEVTLALPQRDDAVVAAVAHIDAEVARVRAQAEMDARELLQRKEKLLAIGWGG